MQEHLWASQRVTESEGVALRETTVPRFHYSHPGILTGPEVAIFTGLPRHQTRWVKQLISKDLTHRDTKGWAISTVN